VLLLSTQLVFAESSVVTLTIAYEDKEQFPYYLGDTDEVLTNPGVAVEMVQQLKTLVPDIKIVLKRYPWKRCLTLLEYGNVDAIFNASYNRERASYGVYPLTEAGLPDLSRRLTTISYSWYALVGTSPKAVESRKFSVAAPAGYSIVKQLQEDGYDVSEPAHSHQALKMVQAGRVRAAALQTVTGDALLQENQGLNGLTRLSPPIISKPYYLVFSQDFMARHPELVTALWQALSQLRESEMPKLIKKYTSSASQGL
jgi:polar amino acid transport system substrate-binding protein